MFHLDYGFAIVGGWFILFGIITVLRRKSLSATWVQRMRFWLGRNEDPALAEFDRAIAGWFAVAFGVMLLLFQVFG